MQRKYPKLNLQEGQYYVYVHTVTTEQGQKLYYIGMSQTQPARRWMPSKYKDTTLHEYIERYSWDNIGHQVLAIVADKRSAETLEDQMIMALSMNDIVINERRSGGHARDNDDVRKEYLREYDKSERGKAAHRKADAKYNAKSENKIYYRVQSYNRNHPDLVTETPLEAKQRYLNEGIIPDYIKHDDI